METRYVVQSVKAGNPDFEKWDNEIDHIWHEFEGLEPSNELPTDARTLKQFLESIPLQT